MKISVFRTEVYIFGMIITKKSVMSNFLALKPLGGRTTFYLPMRIEAITSVTLQDCYNVFSGQKNNAR